jgi:hypothetical protein
MSNLQGHVGELTFNVQVTRKATGKVEEYQLVGGITDEQAQALGLALATVQPKENEDGRNP